MTQKNIKKILTAALFMLLIMPATGMAQVSFESNQERGNRFNFELSQGESLNYTFQISNVSEDALQIKLGVADGTHTNTGSFTVTNEALAQKSIGKWLTLRNTDITIPAKSSRKISFSIKIPEKTTPGDYGGGITAIPILKNRSELQGSGARSILRLVAPVFIHVRGEKITKYSWENFTHTRTEDQKNTFNLTFKNQGNTAFYLKGNIKIKDILNTEHKEVTLPATTIFQEDTVDLNGIWQETPFFGFYTATAEIEVSEIDVSNGKTVPIEKVIREIHFSIVPVGAIIGAGTTILLAGLVITLRYRKLKKLIKSCSPYVVKEDETLEQIAKTHNIDWQHLAKVNKLKPPYSLKPGTTIIVPPEQIKPASNAA